ncbi:ribose-5-phosphate isomerase RpiA [Lentibacillus sp. N15]|uniref:ribose-5-phosphate isomerase RpiA n=1 Tax=Lentibacillus songyuanensis TaxID=3136161 RepID=UPI0031BB4231
MNPIERQKQLAGEEAISFIKNGMTIGLGSGSTVNMMLKALGERVQEGLNIKGIPTSLQTEELAHEYGIPLTRFADIEQMDVAIDGADEVDDHLNLVKGGGGCLVREKIVAAAAKQLIIIVDESKLVPHLGAFPLPIEVVSFGWEFAAKRIAELGSEPQLRKGGNGDIFVSDNGNYILDCAFHELRQPKQLHAQLKAMVGVVDTGLFVGMADRVIVATGDGINMKHA